MDSNERKGWTEIVVPEDYDSHMSEIGQAEANALLVADMFKYFPLKESASLLVPGAGTGQMFEYITPFQIGLYKFTFSDISSRLLEKLNQRLLKMYPRFRHKAVLDDIEETRLKGSYDGILTVLLLQHIEWKKGIESMVEFEPEKMYFIIQQQDNKCHAINIQRKLRPSIAEFAKIANPHLVLRQELVDYLEDKNYGLLDSYEKQVLDNKTMVGLVFEKS
jgi:hypothetical protein